VKLDIRKRIYKNEYIKIYQINMDIPKKKKNVLFQEENVHLVYTLTHIACDV